MLPRDRLLASGADTLSDAELLAVLFGGGAPAAARAVATLADHGGLRGLFETELGGPPASSALSLSQAARLLAARALAERLFLADCRSRCTITDPGATRAYLRLRLGGEQREVFAALFLDSQHRLIEYEVMSLGTLDGASVYPREIVKAVLRHNAAAVIFAHNHPSGVAEPSTADRRITERLQAALRLIDVRVLDHFIVGEGEVLSFAERGLL